jgi:hypothetical protein
MLSASSSNASESSHSKCEKKSASFFPANVKAATFRKERKHFANEEKEFKLADGFDYHKANLLNKNPKPQKINPQRDQANWVKIENSHVEAKKRHALNQIIVAMGECARFDIGNMMPKYRIMIASDGTEYPISKQIPGYQDFYDVSVEIDKREHPQPEDFYQGQGRAAFFNWGNYENDFHFGNAALNQDNYFVVYDHDQKFGTVTIPLRMEFNEIDNKYVTYDLSTHKNIGKQFIKPVYDAQSKLTGYCLRGTKMHFMGESRTSDYQILPEVHYFVPTCWDYNKTNKLKEYSRFLAKHRVFLNEKHLSAFKSFVTQNIKAALLDIHIENPAHCNMIKELMLKRFPAFLQDESFQKYLAENRIAAMKAIMYEMYEFLKDNKHYCYDTPEMQQAQWQAMCADTVKQFSELLKACKQAEISQEELTDLQQFSGNLQLKTVYDFYHHQGMTYNAVAIMQQYSQRSPSSNSNQDSTAMMTQAMQNSTVPKQEPSEPAPEEQAEPEPMVVTLPRLQSISGHKRQREEEVTVPPSENQDNSAKRRKVGVT